MRYNDYPIVIQKMLDFMEQNLKNNITVKQIADAVGYSPWHCSRIFKKYYGESPAACLRQMRLLQASKKLKGKAIRDIALEYSFSSQEGFSKAFSKEFACPPSQYRKESSQDNCPHKIYEYKGSPAVWGSGINPTEDGLWEFEYYDPVGNHFGRMLWTGEQFEAPFHTADASDPFWYCRNRNSGYGMHPGRIVNAVKTFCCPESGTVDFFLSAGRIYSCENSLKSLASSLRVLQNQTQVFPKNGAKVLTRNTPIQVETTLAVHKGDKIRILVDAMGDAREDGLILYREKISYREVTQET